MNTPATNRRPMAFAVTGAWARLRAHDGRRPGRSLAWTCWFLCLLWGCGTTREKLATEQLLLSDAVDRAVARIDFSPLTGETVFLDTSYVRQLKPTSFVSTDYIISATRQQMVLAGCLLQDNRDDANYVAELRVGVLGSDAHDVNFGVPGSQGISQAASLVSPVGPIPALPEISFARRTDDSAAAKVAVFAYNRLTREPVWQSGTSVARSSAHAKWVLGAGPFQSGSIYSGTQFAGDKLKHSKLATSHDEDELQPEDVAYRDSAVWDTSLQNKLRHGRSAAASAPQVAQQKGAASPAATPSPSSVSPSSPPAPATTATAAAPTPPPAGPSAAAGPPTPPPAAPAVAATPATASPASATTPAPASDTATPASAAQNEGGSNNVKQAEFKSDMPSAEPKRMPPVK